MRVGRRYPAYLYSTYSYIPSFGTIKLCAVLRYRLIASTYCGVVYAYLTSIDNNLSIGGVREGVTISVTCVLNYTIVMIRILILI